MGDGQLSQHSLEYGADVRPPVKTVMAACYSVDRTRLVQVMAAVATTLGRVIGGGGTGLAFRPSTFVWQGRDMMPMALARHGAINVTLLHLNAYGLGERSMGVGTLVT